MSDQLVRVCFFFFQAEDGIRDLTVTGVQTCALPISSREDPGILEKEGPLLREEQRKAGEVGALLIDLDLREVGVVREVEGETGGHAILDLAADLPAPAGFGSDRVVAFHAREPVGRDGPYPSGRHLDTLQRPGTRDLHQAELARNEGPKRPFRLAAGSRRGGGY